MSWLIALLPTAFNLYFNKRLFTKTPFDIAIVVLTTGMIYGFIHSSARGMAVSALNTYFAGLLFYYTLVGNRQARRTYWLILAACFFLVLLSLAVLVFSGNQGKVFSFNSWIYRLGEKIHLFTGVVMHPNVLGALSALCLPILLAVALFQQKFIMRILSGIGAILIGVLLFLSASGGSWIAALIGVFIVLLVRGFETPMRVVLGLCFTALVSAPLWFKAPWIGQILPYQDLLAREDFWRATLGALGQHPIAGLGLGAWWSVVQTNITSGGPHNTYLQLYSDCGIVGMVALVAVIATGLSLSARLLRGFKDGPYFGLSAGLIGGCATVGALGFIENIFVVLTPVGNTNVCFTVPLIWILLALMTIVPTATISKNAQKPHDSKQE